MALQKCYYITPYHVIGGAEKRFIELYSYLQQNEKRFDFYLIISIELHEQLKQVKEIYKTLQPWEHKIITYRIDMNGPVSGFQKKLYDFVCSHTTGDDILHFIIFFPTFIFPLKHKKVIYSLTESSLQNVNINGRIVYLMNVFRAKFIDVLDPPFIKNFLNIFFIKEKI